MATRSAQIVSPEVAFSMLQPVMIVPSAASRAAPTLKPEKRAWAWRRARRAAAIKGGVVLPFGKTRDDRDRRSDALKDAFDQRREGAAYTPGCFHYLIMDQRLRQHASGHVRD